MDRSESLLSELIGMIELRRYINRLFLSVFPQDVKQFWIIRNAGGERNRNSSAETDEIKMIDFRKFLFVIGDYLIVIQKRITTGNQDIIDLFMFFDVR